MEAQEMRLSSTARDVLIIAQRMLNVRLLWTYADPELLGGVNPSCFPFVSWSASIVWVVIPCTAIVVACTYLHPPPLL